MSLPEARMTVRRRNELKGRRATSRGRRGTQVAFAAAVALLASACGDTGFRPMYGSVGANGLTTNEKLAQVDIATIPGRVGQQVRNEFIYQSTGGGDAAPQPLYRLEVAIRESVSSALVQLTGEARGQIYNLDASFRLVRLSDSQVVLQGESNARAGFDRVSSIYANVRARQEAEDRAAKTIGEDLKTRVAAYLATAA